jgi:hypothetical protein
VKLTNGDVTAYGDSKGKQGKTDYYANPPWSGITFVRLLYLREKKRFLPGMDFG